MGWHLSDYLLDGGVAMYNGYNWVDFNMSDGLIGPVISDLIIDDQDQVWVATSSGISKITEVLPIYLILWKIKFQYS